MDKIQGLGFGIEKGQSGRYIAISAGTGLVPFMDMVCYLFRKNVTNAAKKKGIQINGFEDEQFDLLGEEFHLELWASFTRRE